MVLEVRINGLLVEIYRLLDNAPTQEAMISVLNSIVGGEELVDFQRTVEQPNQPDQWILA